MQTIPAGAVATVLTNPIGAHNIGMRLVVFESKEQMEKELISLFEEFPEPDFRFHVLGKYRVPNKNRE